MKSIVEPEIRDTILISLPGSDIVFMVSSEQVVHVSRIDKNGNVLQVLAPPEMPK